MAQIKTYLLAPSFTYKPSGPIQLGNIIANPLRPAKALSTLKFAGAAEFDPNAAIETVVEYDYELSQGKGRSVRAGLWAHFLQNVVGGGVNASRDADSSTTYHIDRLETQYLRELPSEEELRARLSEPRVRAVVTSSYVLGRRAPVYVISGLKIARGLRVTNMKSRTFGGGVSVDVPVLPDGVLASVGGELGAEQRDGETRSFRSGEEDIIFAYELSVIRLKGRKDRETIEVDILEHAAAFLHEEDESQCKRNEEIDVAVGVAGAEDIVESGLEVNIVKVQDENGDMVACVTAS
ncbi:hypothetical protein PG990_010811 [Apiospora arundinis]